MGMPLNRQGGRVRAPLGGGRAKIENSPRPHPRKFGQKRFLAVRRSWRGNGVACFWATSLEKIFGGTTTLAAAKGRLIRCTVPGSTPNCLAMTRTPGCQEPPGPTPTRCATLRSSLARRYHPADSNCERIRSEHFLDFMKQRHSPLLRSGPPV